jgi:nitric oxide reductase NorQ protein
MLDTAVTTTHLHIPETDPFFYVTNELAGIIGKIRKISQKHPVNILVTGRQGCGKSSLVKQYASIFQCPLATFQVGILSEPGQLFGEYALENGETRYKQFLFPQAIQTPNCVIHLEEINRPENPKALNMLFSILSDDREVWLDELGTLKVADGVVFFATLNEGDDYTGTEMLDPALRDRFYTLLMDYLPPDVEKEILIKKSKVTEKQADDIIGAVNQLRTMSEYNIEVSTRTTLMIGEMVAVGTSLRDAIVVSLQAGKEHLESILLSLHLEKGYRQKGEAAYLRLTNEAVANEEKEMEIINR